MKSKVLTIEILSINNNINNKNYLSTICKQSIETARFGCSAVALLILSAASLVSPSIGSDSDVCRSQNASCAQAGSFVPGAVACRDAAAVAHLAKCMAQGKEFAAAFFEFQARGASVFLQPLRASPSYPWRKHLHRMGLKARRLESLR